MFIGHTCKHIYTKCGVSSLSVCLSVIHNAFIQFASDLHGISHGCSHVLCVCLCIKIAAISLYGRLCGRKLERCAGENR
jgi:hypothetical protein